MSVEDGVPEVVEFVDGRMYDATPLSVEEVAAFQKEEFADPRAGWVVKALAITVQQLRGDPEHHHVYPWSEVKAERKGSPAAKCRICGATAGR